MNKSVVFSVITPSYNQGEFIEETIKSVISQEGNFYIEYIIMDGGSKDNSVDVIKKYERLLKERKWEIKCLGIDYFWVSEKDKGQVDAIEKGFFRARGEIGTWLNSDDIYYDNEIFARVLKEFQKDVTLEMVTGDGIFIDKMGQKIGFHHAKGINFTELIYLDYHILQPATFLKESIYKNEKLDKSYNYCFDAEYFIRLINKEYRYKKIDIDLACFRFYPEIKTISGANKRYSESLRISRIFGKSSYYYWISVFYKYWIIVLINKYPSFLIKKLTFFFRAIAYRLVMGERR